MRIAFCLAFIVSSAFAASVEFNPLSDEFINHINSQQTTWRAGRNFPVTTSTQDIKKLLGYLRRDPVQLGYEPTVHSEDVTIPDTFDARSNWPECTKVISTVPDQSSCGSCWAVSAASAMSDRRCIATKGQLTVPVSAEDVLSCCGFACGMGCNGGYIDAAWNYWTSSGIVSGGLFNSSQGCKPYSMQSCDHHVVGSLVPCDSLNFNTPKCTKTCTSGHLEYNSDKSYGQGRASWLRKVEDIQREILQNGPVSAGFNVYADFLAYKSGVYQHVSGSYEGGHAVRIIGWGTENNVDYWLISNSWNEDWGDKGFFKIKRGNNESGIENEVYATQAKV